MKANKLVDRVKKKLTEIIDEEYSTYFEDQMYILENYGYKLEHLSEEIKDIGRWHTDTEHVFKITDTKTKESVLLAIIDTTGNTESQENEGITDMYEVRPKEVLKTIYERVE